jgi:hypothetical protein
VFRIIASSFTESSIKIFSKLRTQAIIDIILSTGIRRNERKTRNQSRNTWKKGGRTVRKEVIREYSLPPKAGLCFTDAI